MSEENKKDMSFGDELIAESAKPLTMKDRFIGLALAVLLIGICIAVWLHPEIPGLADAEFSGRGGKKVATVLDWLWSRPVGTILGLLGLIVAYGTLTKPGVKKSEDAPVS